MEKYLKGVLGTIYKEERLVNMDFNIIPETLVVEISDPFHGYHHEIPKVEAPSDVFLVTSANVSRELVSRASKNIRQYFLHSFDAAPANIKIYNNNYDAIRIKGLENYDNLRELQECFSSEGFAFRRRKKIDEMGLIRVKKYFDIMPSDDNMFFDIDPTICYFTITENVGWKLFVKITKSIRNNWDFKEFDAALGTIYLNREIEDIVRIYMLKQDKDILNLLKDKYYKEISKY